MSTSPLSVVVARTVRELRTVRGWTIATVAKRSGLSLRLLALIEAGEANPTLRSLEDLAGAFGVDVAALVQRKRKVRPIALLGLRGAGKSTVGQALATELGWSFVETDRLIEQESGLSLAALFELHGEPRVRALEAQVVADVVDRGAVVVAVGGGVVSHKETFALLRARTFTVWLKARPQDHWDRVRAQGDERPMAGSDSARAELDALWSARAPRYAEAALVVDTSDLDVDGVVGVIRRALHKDDESTFPQA